MISGKKMLKFYPNELRIKHRTQVDLWSSDARFRVVPAGRRSGKTAFAKRYMLIRAMMGSKFKNPRYFLGAPTWRQAKNIFWKEMKELSRAFWRQSPSESEMIIYLANGADLYIVGLDKPERIEGQPWDGCIIDEFANVKPGAWEENIRPALSDREGWAWIIGVPEGRNHYYDLFKYAISGVDDEWEGFTWKSADIIAPKEIASAKRTMDQQTFSQEYEASFLNFSGRAYYNFNQDIHGTPIMYDPYRRLNFAFDFNVDPGIAVVIQELPIGKSNALHTCVIGEVYIPQNSTTPAVCRKLVQDWSFHEGTIAIYGDATGGSRGTAKVNGSDWDLIKEEMLIGFPKNEIVWRVPKSNPSERSRVNAVNSRLQNGLGESRFFIDPAKAPNVIRDLEGVVLLEGGSGEIDKKKYPDLTHISDALGYYIAKEHPLVKQTVKEDSLGGFY